MLDCTNVSIAGTRCQMRVKDFEPFLALSLMRKNTNTFNSPSIVNWGQNDLRTPLHFEFLGLSERQEINPRALKISF